MLYHCYRADCKLRGKSDYEIPINILSDYVNSLAMGSTKGAKSIQNSKVTYTIPDYFVSPLSNGRSYSLLSRFNLLDLYSQFPDRIRYDPKLDRLVFILKDLENGSISGACGRILSYRPTLPRWYIYKRIDGCPFILEKVSSRAILVEDCISACVIRRLASNIVDGISILGTSIPDNLLNHLLKYDKLYLALDDDATGKAIQLQKHLQTHVETAIIPLRKDLKYFSQDEFQQLRKEYLDG